MLQPGDRVLVKVVAFDGRHKLANKCEEDPYNIVDQANREIIVYVVRKVDGKAKTKTLHRNISINFLPSDDIEKEVPAPAQKTMRTRKQGQSLQETVTKSSSIDDINEVGSNEESEQDFWIYPVLTVMHIWWISRLQQRKLSTTRVITLLPLIGDWGFV